MKNKLLIIVILSISICAKAQEKVVDVENLIPFFFKVDSIENLKVFINPKKELQYIRVVKNINLSQEQLFKRVYSYFIYNYNDAKSVIQLNDKESGQIIGKGLYNSFASNKFEITQMGYKFTYVYSYSSYHLLQVDIKDNKMRIILTVQNVDEDLEGTSGSKSLTQKEITTLAPFRVSKIIQRDKLRGIEKQINIMTKGLEDSETIAFQKLGQKCISTIEDLIQHINDNNKNNNVITEDW